MTARWRVFQVPVLHICPSARAGLSWRVACCPELLDPERQMAQAGVNYPEEMMILAALEMLLVGITAQKAASIGTLTIDLEESCLAN